MALLPGRGLSLWKIPKILLGKPREADFIHIAVKKFPSSRGVRSISWGVSKGSDRLNAGGLNLVDAVHMLSGQSPDVYLGSLAIEFK